MDIKEILKKHKLWLEGHEDGIIADLSNANLRGANSYDKFYYIGNIGSRNSQTTVNLTKNIVWCGCFVGTLEEFKIAVKNHHYKNEHYYDYMDFIELCEKKIERMKK